LVTWRSLSIDGWFGLATPTLATTEPPHFPCGRPTSLGTPESIGNRQLNAALDRIAITQAHYNCDARACLQQRRIAGDSAREHIRAPRAPPVRHLSSARCWLTTAEPSSRTLLDM
jgi:hypothetical protein